MKTFQLSTVTKLLWDLSQRLEYVIIYRNMYEKIHLLIAGYLTSEKKITLILIYAWPLFLRVILLNACSTRQENGTFFFSDEQSCLFGFSGWVYHDVTGGYFCSEEIKLKKMFRLLYWRMMFQMLSLTSRCNNIVSNKILC
jgi:hypothetical protein